MKRITGVFAFGLLCSGEAHAGLSVGAGTEYMEWREYDAYTDEKLLSETGLRFFAAASFAHPLDRGIDLAYSAKLYGGDVDYDGQYQDGTPVTADTGYDGINVEARALFSPQRPGFYGEAPAAVVFGLGLDAWTRNISGPGGYKEQYQLSYVRLGLTKGPAGSANPWSARVGLLHPIDVQEEVDLLDGVDLEPKGKPSFYLYVGYRFVPEWELGLGYQGYRLGASNPSSGPVTENGVPVDLNGDGIARDFVLQPDSELDTYRFTLRRRF